MQCDFGRTTGLEGSSLLDMAYGVAVACILGIYMISSRKFAFSFMNSCTRSFYSWFPISRSSYETVEESRIHTLKRPVVQRRRHTWIL